MPTQIFTLKTHIAFQSSLAASVVVILMTIILFVIYQTLRKKQDSDVYVNESRNIFFMIFYFTFFVLTRPLAITLPGAVAASWNMKVHIIISLYAMYHFLHLIFLYSREQESKNAKIITKGFLIYTVIFTIVSIFTHLLIDSPHHFDQNGWTFNYGPLFNFGFGIPFFVVISFGLTKLIKSRKFFKDNLLEKGRYMLIVSGVILMITGSISEVLSVFLNYTVIVGDTAILGVSFLSLFIGLASIIQFYQIQVQNQKSEDELKSVFSQLKKSMDAGKDHISKLSPSVEDINHIAVDLADFVDLSKMRTQNATDKSINQKKQIKNFSSMVISNITTFDDILKSMNEQKAKIQQFKDIINDVNTLLKEISEKGKIVSGGVVNLNSVINDAKIHSDSNYKLINEVKLSINKIVKVTLAIDRVSEDSNVLSMNASIESATSGDIGKGFKVVADDLRNMSIRTYIETNKIKEILHLLQSDLEEGFSSAGKVKAFFTELEKTIEKVFNFIMTIIQNTNQLIEKIEKVNITIDSLLEIARESLAKGDQQQSLNNDLNESIISLKYMIESIHRAMNETMEIMHVVFQFSAMLQHNAATYQVKNSELTSVLNNIESNINQTH